MFFLLFDKVNYRGLKGHCNEIFNFFGTLGQYKTFGIFFSNSYGNIVWVSKNVGYPSKHFSNASENVGDASKDVGY